MPASSEAPAEPEHLPRRILLAPRRWPIPDELGFVRPIAVDRIFRVADLLDQPAALIVAPPWTGKTFVARQLHGALQASARFGDFHHLVSFERPGRVLPPWWELWKEGDRPACWIVDAVDEDERLGEGRHWQEILERIADLRPEEQARLHVLFFCRENEVPSRFEQSLADIYGVNLRQLRLAGLDRESARELVGADCFEKVCRQIEAGSLKEVAALPVVLEHLKRNVAEPVSQTGVWRGVLMDLLRDRRGRARLSATATEVEDRFEVVQWLAAVLTFSGVTEMSLEAPGPASPSLEEIVPRSIPSSGSLREAAREAVRTAVFERSDENRFRFSQDHVRQWFAAFALKDKELLRIRPLLMDEAGQPNHLHKGVMDILARITDKPEVRDWINQAHGSILPPPGAGPWTLADVVRALDALQDLAREAPWGLPLWREERLAGLAVPGVGAQIARRLEERLSTEEQELLLDIALAVGVSEPLSIAVRIVQDRGRDRRVRALAADLVARFGEKEQLEPLERWARARGAADDGAEGALTVLAASFFKKGLWDFEAATDFALSRLKPGSEWLQYLLAEEMTADSARRIVMRSLTEPLLYRKPILRKALEKVEKDAAARRKLFLAGLQQDPKRSRTGGWHWVLRGEDTEWLLEVIAGRGGEPEWLWETIYFLSYRRSVPPAMLRRVRRAIRTCDPRLLSSLDRERKIWIRGEARSLQKREGTERIDRLLTAVEEGSPASDRIDRLGPAADSELWIEQARAEAGADSVLSGTGFLRGEIPVDRVVRLLMDVRYRLIRTADDLLDLVLEELRSIAGDVKHHLAMLYRPREGGRRRRLPEEALQAYLHCRLMDRMTSGYLDPQPQVVFLNREPLAARNKRNDLKIETLSFDGKPLTLIIEIKWSDNRDVSISQTDQLGADYLVKSDCSHGIYLVGWCGKSGPWKDVGVPPPEPRSSVEAWRASLKAQAVLFQEKHAGIRIEPILMDLAWESGPTATG